MEDINMLDSIKGQVRVFTRTIDTAKGTKKVLFSACLGSTKNDDGEYINWYVDLAWSEKVKKEVAKVYEQKSFDIKIEDSWFKPYRSKDDTIKTMLFVNKATVITAEAEPKAKAKKKEAEPAEDDGELPF